MVVRTLAGSPLATLGIVRNYLKSVSHTELKQINEHASVIDQYQVDTQKVRDRIHELQSQALTLKQTKCAACNENLELPTVHFLCDHSYHVHCFSSYADNDTDCPACLNDNRKILDIVKSQQQSREQHDAFHSQLEKADDGFAVVADYFGRGMFRGQTFLESSAATSDRHAAVPRASVKQQLKGATADMSAVEQLRKSPVFEEKPVAVTTRKTPPNSNPFGETTQKTPPNSNPFGENLSEEKVIESKNESLNPFGTPEDSPEKEVSNNPFGEDDDEDYNEALNPFA